MDNGVVDAMADQPRPQSIVQFMYQDHTFRALIDKDGRPWFCVTDLCRSLGYTNSRSTLEKHCVDVEGVAQLETITKGRVQSVTFISETNLYMLICGRKLAAVKSFLLWITHDVLPALRTRWVCALRIQSRTSVPNYTDAPEEAGAIAKLPETNQAPMGDLQRLHLKLVEKVFRISALEAEKTHREGVVRFPLATLYHAAMLRAAGRDYADIAHLLGADLDLAQRMVVTWETLSELKLVPALQEATPPTTRP
ncbi:BRO family protein [Cupriavidus basilensis]|uniref:BRO family protein n=1 Tax=Cupriavidus basilensis TaxID=68895 RepID=A0ABT6AGE9_9BURK|nr:BRO family protein [Cupriavidus basilensis]MDF3831534.1 BRO family protein [Cupriavidus basilensis]